ncbi:MAG: hypothetical protein KF752_09965 [Pirellulaceae bacterium]|nr:hypothetical protein [Pirellulaceae bacterium]
MRQSPFVWLACLVLVLANSAHGQPAVQRELQDDWELEAVLVPESDEGQRIPSDYWPVEISELVSRLQQIQQRRLSQQMDPPGVAEAVYVATLNREMVASELSCWRFSGLVPEVNHSATLGEVSLALRDARGISDGMLQLSRDLSFDGLGALVISASAENPTRWFGFQLTPTVTGDQRSFKFRLPPAMSGRLLLATDSSLKLTSPQVAIEKVERPESYLPPDWPASSEPTLVTATEKRVWWLAHLSGVSQFELLVATDSSQPVGVLNHLLRSANCRYMLDHDELRVVSRFVLSSHSAGGTLQLRLDPALRLTDLSRDGETMAWEVVSEPNLLGNIIAIESGSTPGGVIEVQAVASLVSILQPAADSESNSLEAYSMLAGDKLLGLPRIELVNAFIASGTSEVIGLTPHQILDVQSDVEFRLQPSDEAPVGELSGGRQRWAAAWMGNPPGAIVRVGRQKQRWSGMSLIRLEPQLTSVVANVAVQLRGRDLTSNQLRLPIHPGWTVDQMQIMNSDLNGLSIQLLEAGNQPAEIVLNWQKPQMNAECSFQIQAIKMLDTQSPSAAIDFPGIVNWQEGPHAKYYYVANTNRHALRYSTQLTQATVERHELPQWVQSLVPQPVTAIYKDLADAHGLFAFDTLPQDFQAQSKVLVELADESEWNCVTQIDCQPPAAGMDSIDLTLPAGETLSSWKFEWFEGVQQPQSIDATLLEGDSPHSRISFRLTFPRIAGSLVTIRASTSLSTAVRAEGEFPSIALIGIPAASNPVATVCLPQNWTADLAGIDAEVLAAQADLTRDSLGHLAMNSDSASRCTFRVRLNCAGSQRLAIRPVSEPPVKSWIWRAAILHEFDDNGQSRHFVTADVQASGSSVVSLHGPEQWQVVRITIEGQETQSYVWQSGKLELELPATQTANVRCEFIGHQPLTATFSRIALEPVRFDLPVIEQLEQIWFSPNKVLLFGADRDSANDADAEQFIPGRWWQNLFSMEFGSSASEAVVQATTDGDMRPQAGQLMSLSAIGAWDVKESSGSLTKPRMIWIANRHALASFMAATMLLGAVVSWVTARRSWINWWCLLSAWYIGFLVTTGFIAACGQLLVLAHLIGGVARLVETLSVRSQDTAVLNRAIPKVTSLLLACLMLNGLPAHGQETEKSAVGHATEKKVYGLFLPVDQQGQVAGEYAYLPKELRDLLMYAGAQSTDRAAPRYLSVNYGLKIRPGTREAFSQAELTVELRVSASNSSSELLLPFRPSQLRLVGAPQLNGQARLMDARNFRVADGDAGIVFRPDSAGESLISLQFSTRARTVGDRRAAIDVSIPPIANATLRIHSVEQVEQLSVEARGAMQRSFSGDYLVAVGPVQRLQASWTETDRANADEVAEQVTETWLHAEGDQLYAACRVTIDGVNVLPAECDLLIDSDWQPVGTELGDAQLLTTAFSNTTLKRSVRRLRLKEAADSRRVIQLALVRRADISATGFEVPFISLDRVTIKAKNFWWSKGQRSSWVPDTAGAKPILAVDVADWNDWAPAQQRSGFQVLGSAIRVRYQALASEQADYSESTAIYFQSGRTILHWNSVWRQSPDRSNVIRLELPESAQVTLLEVNGRVQESGALVDNRQLVIPARGEGVGQMSTLNLTLELPPLLGEINEVPRIVVHGYPPRAATYRLFRGPELKVSVQPMDSRLAIVSPSQAAWQRSLLHSLDIMLGQFDLPASWLSRLRLPIAVRIDAAPVPSHPIGVLTVDRQGPGWRATVRCGWLAEDSLDFGVFDIPLTLRERLTTSGDGLSFLPHADGKRTYACIPVPPANPEGRREIEFSFPLESSSATRSVIIPKIAVQQGQELALRLALPRHLNGQPLRWRRGESVPERLETIDAHPSDADHQVYELPLRTTQWIWQSETEQQEPAKVAFVWTELQYHGLTNALGTIHYWVVPNGQFVQQFSIPADCQVLGVEVAGRQALWSTGNSQLEVVLQPSYLPVPIRMVVRWQNSSNQLQMFVPRAIGSRLPDEMLLSTTAAMGAQSPPREAVAVDANPLRDAWEAMLLECYSGLEGRESDEMPAELEGWQPWQFGLSGQESIRDEHLQAILANSDMNEDGMLTVAEAWASIAGATATENWGLPKSASHRAAVSGVEFWKLPAWEMNWDFPTQPRPMTRSRSMVVGLLVIAFIPILASLWLGQRMSMLQEHRYWPPWIFLTVLVGVASPFSWITGLVGCLTAWALLSRRFLGGRRTDRRLHRSGKGDRELLSV